MLQWCKGCYRVGNFWWETKKELNSQFYLEKVEYSAIMTLFLRGRTPSNHSNNKSGVVEHESQTWAKNRKLFMDKDEGVNIEKESPTPTWSSSIGALLFHSCIIPKIIIKVSDYTFSIVLRQNPRLLYLEGLILFGRQLIRFIFFLFQSIFTR